MLYIFKTLSLCRALNAWGCHISISLLILFRVIWLGMSPVSECKNNTNDYKMQIGNFDLTISEIYTCVC